MTYEKPHFLRASIERWKKSQRPERTTNVELLGHEYIVNQGVFSPAYFKDSEFFLSVLPIRKDERFFEVGVGIGATLDLAIRKGARVAYGNDIDFAAVKNAKKNLAGKENVAVFQGDVLTGVSGRFDTVYWNFPWGYVNQQLSSPELGTLFSYKYKNLERFFSDVQELLSKEGRILLGFSNEMGAPEILEEIALKNGFARPEILARGETITGVPARKVPIELLQLVPR